MPVKAKSEVNIFTLTVLLIGIFPAFAATLIFGRQTFILVDTTFDYFLLFGSIAFLAHLPFRKKMNRYWAELVAYSFLGWGSLGLAILLSTNFLFHAQRVTTYYGIRTGDIVQAYTYPLKINIDDPKFKDFGYLLDFDEDEIQNPKHITKAWLVTAKGFWGYEVLLKKGLK